MTDTGHHQDLVICRQFHLRLRLSFQKGVRKAEVDCFLPDHPGLHTEHLVQLVFCNIHFLLIDLFDGSVRCIQHIDHLLGIFQRHVIPNHTRCAVDHKHGSRIDLNVSIRLARNDRSS